MGEPLEGPSTLASPELVRVLAGFPAATPGNRGRRGKAGRESRVSVSSSLRTETGSKIETMERREEREELNEYSGASVVPLAPSATAGSCIESHPVPLNLRATSGGCLARRGRAMGLTDLRTAQRGCTPVGVCSGLARLGTPYSTVSIACIRRWSFSLFSVSHVPPSLPSQSRSSFLESTRANLTGQG